MVNNEFFNWFREVAFSLVKLELEKLLSDIELEKINDKYLVKFNKSENNTASCDITHLLHEEIKLVFRKVYSNLGDEYIHYMVCSLGDITDLIKDYVLKVIKTYEGFKIMEKDKIFILMNLESKIISVNDIANIDQRPHIICKDRAVIFRVTLIIDELLLLTIDIDNKMMEEYNIILDELFLNTINDSINVFID